MKPQILSILLSLIALPVLSRGLDIPVAPTVASATDMVQVLPPSGPYAVGTVVHNWIDPSRLEGASENPTDRRQLIVQLWYPAIPSPGETFPFFPKLEMYRAAFGDAYPSSLGKIGTHSVVDAASAEGVFPVVLFFHGWNSQRSAYTGLLQEVASQGYVVAGIDQPYAGRVALPSGEVTPSTDGHFGGPQAMLEFYGADADFVLKKLAGLNRDDGRLRGRLALDRVAAVGHSNGAIPAIQVNRTNPRLRGAVLLDSFDRDVEPIFLLDQPLLLIRTGGAKAPSDSYRAAITALVYDLELAGGSHLSSTDLSYLEAPAEERRSAEAFTRRIRHAVVTFLNGILQGEDPSDLESLDLAQEGATLAVLRPNSE